MQDLRSTIKLFEDLGVDVDLNSQNLNKKVNVDYFRFADGKRITSNGEEIHEEIVLKPECIGVVIHFKGNPDVQKKKFKELIKEHFDEFKDDDKFVIKGGVDKESGLVFYEIPNNKPGDAVLEKMMSYDLFVNYKRMHDIVKKYLTDINTRR